MAVFSRCEDVAKDGNTKDHLAWTIGIGDPMYGGAGGGVYPTHDTWRMGTARVKQEESMEL